jgi:hypothetical protein
MVGWWPGNWFRNTCIRGQRAFIPLIPHCVDTLWLTESNRAQPGE